nr:hypothetical protein K08F11.6 - Caenorhabditis elegans [Caenorhabditis elegans]
MKKKSMRERFSITSIMRDLKRANEEWGTTEASKAIEENPRIVVASVEVAIEEASEDFQQILVEVEASVVDQKTAMEDLEGDSVETEEALKDVEAIEEDSEDTTEVVASVVGEVETEAVSVVVVNSDISCCFCNLLFLCVLHFYYYVRYCYHYNHEYIRLFTQNQESSRKSQEKFGI